MWRLRSAAALRALTLAVEGTSMAKSTMQIQPPSRKNGRNVTKATAVGVGAGGTGTALAAWIAAEVERRYGVPAAITAGLLGTGFAFVARWAAKLLPDV